MITKNAIKQIRSLKQKKNREELGIFIVEGKKSITDIFSSFKCKVLYATAEWIEDPQNLSIINSNVLIEKVTEAELEKISFLKSPQQILGVFYKPLENMIMNAYEVTSRELCLALDSVQDPGNLGTIIRLADWFGIHYIYCTNDTVDVYSPKTVQATMGSLARVHVQYLDLHCLVKCISGIIPIYGMFLDGNNIYEKKLEQHGLIIMGNEGNGISKELSPYVTNKLLIPNYPKESDTTESLNVAIATAITCAEFRRKSY